MERFGDRARLTSRENEGTSVCLSFRIADPLG
jgi:two-component system sensor histidine kinase HydH